MNPTTDNELMLRVKGGELEGLNLLFSRYQAMLTGYFYQQSRNYEVAKDLTQDTFWRILRYRQSYQPKSAFKAWMFQIARNIYFDHCKRNKGIFENFEEGVQKEFSEENRPCPHEKNDDIQLLNQAMAKLPEDKREVLILARFENLNYREIASILGCSVNNVKIRVYRALEALKLNYHSLEGGKA